MLLEQMVVGLPETASEERALALKIGCFTDVLDECTRIFSPHPIADYLIDLGARFHKFYDVPEC